MICPYRHFCPPRVQRAIAGGCVTAAWHRACGGEERARLAGCAPSAPLLSPCSLRRPGTTRRHLCVEITKKIAAAHHRLQERE